MLPPDIPIANFTISDNAKRGIDLMRHGFEEASSDPAAVLSIAWGRFMPDAGTPFENVVVSFFGRSQVPQIADAIQLVSGLEVVFYTRPKDYPTFEGRVLDFDDDRGFFLRGP